VESPNLRLPPSISIEETSNLKAFVSSTGSSINIIVPVEETSSQIQNSRNTPEVRSNNQKKRGILKTQNSVQSKKEKNVSIQEDVPNKAISNRSLSQKNISDHLIKSSSSFNEKDKEMKNSIISEEDSAFEDQTPAKDHIVTSFELGVQDLSSINERKGSMPLND
jgi:hypothetical protein